MTISIIFIVLNICRVWILIPLLGALPHSSHQADHPLRSFQEPQIVCPTVAYCIDFSRVSRNVSRRNYATIVRATEAATINTNAATTRFFFQFVEIFILFRGCYRSTITTSSTSKCPSCCSSIRFVSFPCVDFHFFSSGHHNLRKYVQIPSGKWYRRHFQPNIWEIYRNILSEHCVSLERKLFQS